MRFIEETEAAWSAEQLAAAEREIDEQKREWEQNRLAALREEEKRRARELEEENDMLTYSREDATNQVSTKNRKLNVQGASSSSSSGVKKSVRKAETNKVRVVKRGGAKGKNLRNKLIVNVKKDIVSDSDSDVKVKSRCRKQESKTEDESNSSIKNESKTEIVSTVNDMEESSQTPTENSDSTYNSKVNGGGTDSDFKSDSGEEDDEENSDSSSSYDNATPIPPNHVDHNSPRTRSRGTVAINLWTLDVSPILPGVKPVKNAPPVHNCRRERRNKDKDEDENKKSVKRSGTSTPTENKDGKGNNNRKIGRVKNSGSSDDNKKVKFSKGGNKIKSSEEEESLKKTKVQSKKGKSQEDKEIDELKENENIKTDVKEADSQNEVNLENADVNSDDNSLKQPCDDVQDEAAKSQITLENAKLDTNVTSHSKDDTDVCKESLSISNKEVTENVHVSESQAIKTKITDHFQSCNNINEKSFGKNGKICKVVITDIMSDGTLSKELAKYTGTHVVEDSGEFTSETKTDLKLLNVSDTLLEKKIAFKNDLKESKSIGNLLEGKTNKKPIPKKIGEIKKTFIKRRRLIQQNTSLDNWLIKSPSPKRNTSNCDSTIFSAEPLENKGTSDDNSLVDKHVDDEVTENIAVKAEITKVATDVGDIVVNTIKEDSLKRTCNDSESLDDNGIKTNKIIKTA